jgi:hypothetical protein
MGDPQHHRPVTLDEHREGDLGCLRATICESLQQQAIAQVGSRRQGATSLESKLLKLIIPKIVRLLWISSEIE